MTLYVFLFYDQHVCFIQFQLYSIILSCIGFLYMMYLLIDIHRYKNIALKNQKIKAQHEEALEIYFQKQEVCKPAEWQNFIQT